MDVNCYCKIKDDYIIGESTMLRFTLEDGLDEVYHEIINPGKTWSLRVPLKPCRIKGMG